jgi:hypothetical protein
MAHAVLRVSSTRFASARFATPLIERDREHPEEHEGDEAGEADGEKEGHTTFSRGQPAFWPFTSRATSKASYTRPPLTRNVSFRPLL